MKRYLIFSHLPYAADGGWNDFIGTEDTLESAIKLANDHDESWYWHVVDTHPWAIVAHN